MSKKSSSVSVGCKLQVSNEDALCRHHSFTWFLVFNCIGPFIITSWPLFGGVWLVMKHTHRHTHTHIHIKELMLEIKFYNITIYLRDLVAEFLNFYNLILNAILSFRTRLFQFNRVTCLLFIKYKS